MQKEQQKQSGKPKDGKRDQKPEPKHGEMSKEDAQRLLEAMAQEEKSAQEKAGKKKPEPPAGEDW